MSEDGLVGALVNHVDTQTVTSLHQHIEVLATGVHLNPARVVARGGSLQTVNQLQLTGLRVLLVCPDLVGGQIGRVQVGLGGVEHHAVNTSVLLVLVVLHIDVQGSIGLHREDVAVSRILVERVTVDVVGRLVGGQDEDSAGVGVGAGGEG